MMSASYVISAAYQKGCSDMTAFCHQDIVCPAGSSSIHAFDTDASIRQAACDARVNEAMSQASAQQYHLRLQFCQLHKISFDQIVKFSCCPSFDQLIGHDDQRLRVAYRVHFYPTGIIAGDQLVSGGLCKV